MSKRKKFELIDDSTDIYDPEYVEELLEDDEISAEEEAFMIGYNNQVKMKSRPLKKILSEEEAIIAAERNNCIVAFK